MKRLGNTPVAQAAAKDLERLGTTLLKISQDQQRLANSGQLAARGIEAIGGPTRLTEAQLGVMNRTLKQSLDAFRALGQEAPRDVQKMADAVAKQQKILASQQAGRTFGGAGAAGSVLGQIPGLSAIGGGPAIAAGAAAAAVIALGKAALDSADQLAKLRDQTNISTDDLQLIGAAASQAGNEIGQVGKAVNQFQVRLANGNKDTAEALATLGLSADALKKLPPAEQFFALANAFRAVATEENEAALATQLFGKAGVEILPTLKSNVDDVREGFHRMSAENVEALDWLGDALGKAASNVKAWAGDQLGQLVRVSKGIEEFRANLLTGGAIGVGVVEQRDAFASAMAQVLANRKELGQIGQTNAPIAQSPLGSAEALQELNKGLEAQFKASKQAQRAQEEAERAARELKAAQRDLFGADLVQRAMTYLEALGGIQNVTKLTFDEQRSLLTTLDRATEVFERQGRVIPAALRSIQQELTVLTSIPAFNRGIRIPRIESRPLQVPLDTLDTGPSRIRIPKIESRSLQTILKESSAFNGFDPGALLIQSLTGGGGLRGGLEAIGSDAGARLTGTLAKSISANVGGAFGQGLASVIGPLGALVGPLIEKVARLFKGAPEWQRLQKDIGRDLGVNISDGLAKQLEADSKNLGRQAASLLNLDQIITEGGGVEAFGVDKAIAKTRDLFSMLETGKLSAAQVGGAFEKLFAQILPNAISQTTGLASRQFAELIQLADRFGLKSKEVSQFKIGQASNVTSGLDTFVSNSRVSTQGSATAIGSSIAGVFSTLQAEGTPLFEILKQLDPVIGKFKDRLAESGFVGGAAFEQISRLAALTRDEVAGPALSAVQGLQQVFAGLSNTGLLTQETFYGLTSQVAATFAGLVDQGKDGNDVLRLMQPTLQTIFELQERFGFAVDNATQDLLDQAKAAGIVGDAQKPVQERQLDALDKTNSLLEAIAKALGATLPAAAADGAAKVNDELSKIKNPEIVLGFKVGDIPEVGGITGGVDLGLELDRSIQQFASGGRVLPFASTRPRGTDSVRAMLTPGEIVLNASMQDRLAGNLQSEPRQPVVIQVVTQDGRVIKEQIIDDIMYDKRGFGSALRRVVGVR